MFVQPGISQYLEDEAKRDVEAAASLRKLVRANAEAADRILKSSRDLLQRRGVDDARIDAVSQPKKLGVAKDIIERAQEGSYDAIAAGRRGVGGIQEALLGSLTSKLADYSAVVPVWIVDGEIANDRVMIAVDGSESAYRAVDHAAFMLGKSPTAAVTLFHAPVRLGDSCAIDFDRQETDVKEFIIEGDKRCLADFYAHARSRLQDAGIDADRIAIVESKRKVRIGGAIVEAAKKGDFGTVIVGRRGLGRSFFMGSVSRYVLDKASNRAVWLVS
jgi:nucleotide-binding universal stress UspA family protein